MIFHFFGLFHFFFYRLSHLSNPSFSPERYVSASEAAGTDRAGKNSGDFNEFRPKLVRLEFRSPQNR